MYVVYRLGIRRPLTERRQYVDPKVLQLIDIAPPPRARVIAELKAIAEQFDVAYEPPAEEVPQALANCFCAPANEAL